MKKRILATVLAAVMAVTSLAGCGAKRGERAGTTAGGQTVAESTTAGAAGGFNESGYPIVNEPLTLNVMLGIRNMDSMIEPNDMKVIQDLEAKTGIHIEWEMIKESDWDTKLNLRFASGEYPDIIPDSAWRR